MFSDGKLYGDACGYFLLTFLAMILLMLLIMMMFMRADDGECNVECDEECDADCNAKCDLECAVESDPECGADCNAEGNGCFRSGSFDNFVIKGDVDEHDDVEMDMFTDVHLDTHWNYRKGYYWYIEVYMHVDDDGVRLTSMLRDI